MLWAELKPYHEPEAFIPNIALVIISWRDAFTQWLEAKENEERVEALLEEMPKRVKVLIEVSSPTLQRAHRERSSRTKRNQHFSSVTNYITDNDVEHKADHSLA